MDPFSIATRTFYLEGQPLLIVPENENIVELLKQVWGHVFPEDRKAILRYWKSGQRNTLHVPLICLCNGALDKKGLGSVSCKGFLMRFDAGAINKLTTDVIRKDVVAHELAHVWFWAKDAEEALIASEDAHEKAADARQGMWGFPPLPHKG